MNVKYDIGNESIENHGDAEYALAMSAPGFGLWEWDFRTRKIKLNEGFKKILGLSKDGIGDEPMDWFNRVHKDEYGRVIREFSSFIKKPQSEFTSLHRLRHQNGSYIWIMARGKAKPHEDGHYLRLGGTLIDINQQIELLNKQQNDSEKLVEANEQLHEAVDTFHRYFTQDQIVAIQNQRKGKGRGSIEKSTMLYLDIRQSTKYAEQLGAEEFAVFINNLFTDFMDLIYSSGGTVNKLMGDGLLALFGNPGTSEQHARLAVYCAMQIRKYLVSYNDVRPEGIKDSVKIGIGIATGLVFMGDVGSVRRMEYSILGEAVNVASRLQELAREVSCDILVDGCTLKNAKMYPERGQSGEVKGHRFERVVSELLRGKSKEVETFQIM